MPCQDKVVGQRKHSCFCLRADLGLAALELLHFRETVDDPMQLVAPLAGVLQQQLHLQAAAEEGAVAAASRQLEDAAGTSSPSKEANRRCASSPAHVCRRFRPSYHVESALQQALHFTADFTETMPTGQPAWWGLLTATLSAKS